MKYFFDTEFITGFKRPIRFLPTIGKWNKKEFYIHLVSIGIVSEDGREYYAVSKEINPKLADSWVRENVLDKIEAELYQRQNVFAKTYFNFGLRHLLKQFGKSNKRIADEIYNFVNPDLGFTVSSYNNSELKPNGRLNNHFDIHNVTSIENYYVAQPEFYAYYADYDWVVFCSLFGRMIDLPKGFPMYCKDLKQMFDEKAMQMSSVEATKITCPECTHDMYDYLESKNDKSYKIEVLKKSKSYPKQNNEHNALDDARWSYKLYKFLQSL